MRGWLALLFAAVCLPQAGCSDKGRTLTCADTIANACAAPAACPMTWDDVQADTTFCPGATETSPAEIDCGAYHVLSVKVGADNRTYYYDATSDAGGGGMLRAIVTAHSASATTTCDAGPAAGFMLPTCSGMGSAPLPQCLDAGVDGATD